MSDPELHGYGFEQVARAAQRDGQAEAPWLLLRNMHFPNGTPRDGYAEMEAALTVLQLTARTEWRDMPNGTRMEWVVIVRRSQG